MLFVKLKSNSICPSYYINTTRLTGWTSARSCAAKARTAPPKVS